MTPTQKMMDALRAEKARLEALEEAVREHHRQAVQLDHHAEMLLRGAERLRGEESVAVYLGEHVEVGRIGRETAWAPLLPSGHRLRALLADELETMVPALREAASREREAAQALLRAGLATGQGSPEVASG